MRLITKQEKIKNIVKTWTSQYPKDKKDITLKLIQANPTTEDEIAEIIGNRSWTDNYCDECGKDSDVLIEVGQEPDYESATAYICPNCLQKAIEIYNTIKES